MLDGIVNLERVHGAKVKKGVGGSTRDFNWHRRTTSNRPARYWLASVISIRFEVAQRLYFCLWCGNLPKLGEFIISCNPALVFGMGIAHNGAE